MNSTAKVYAVISGILAFILVLALAMTVLTQPKAPASRANRAPSYRAQAPVSNTTVRSSVRIPSINTIAQSVTVK